MKNSSSVDWNLLLDSNNSVLKTISRWSSGELTTREVVDSVTFTEFSGEFRKLVRNHGTTYGRRLARKALRYRGELV
ncbi:MAG: hypothetical protein HWN81_13990 [Candidatus Lokiarchaeota archaeon]|jgi:hypothetical protein|nr:hypothetical protein [Candidatus Lokiarchaeota archaeon]